MLDYEQCQISNDELVIGGNATVGYGLVEYTSLLDTARVFLPSPQDTMLTTIGGSCDSEWEIVGHTDSIIQANEIAAGCKVEAHGLDETNAVLTIDFGLEEPCTRGYKIELEESNIKIDDRDVVTFGRPFKDILFIMSNCSDFIHIAHTFNDTSSLEILGGGKKRERESKEYCICLLDTLTLILCVPSGGDDEIILGVDTAGFESQIFPEFILDAGEGEDTLTIDDSASEEAKIIEVRPTSVDGGFHGAANANKTIFYVGFEVMELFLGTQSDDLTVVSTSEDLLLNVTLGDGNDTATVLGIQVSKAGIDIMAFTGTVAVA